MSTTLISDLLTAYFWLLLAYMLGVIAWSIVATAREYKNGYTDFYQLEEWLVMLLRRGYDGGNLRFYHEPSEQFLGYRKIIRGKGDYGLELQVFGFQWSDRDWAKARALAERSGLPHWIEPMKTKRGERSTLILACGRDLEVAYGLGREIWTKLFRLTTATPYRASKNRWSMVDELVDGPDYPTPLEDLPPREYMREMGARRRKLGQPSLTLLVVSGLSALSLFVCSVGFAIAMLAARGEPVQWSFDLGAFSFGGSVASVVWLTLILLSYWGMRLVKSKRKRPILWIRTMRRIGRALAIGLPLAVLLAWAGY